MKEIKFNIWLQKRLQDLQVVQDELVQDLPLELREKVDRKIFVFWVRKKRT